MKQRKVPLRKCIVTNEMKPKQELVRIVRTPEGTVELDPTGKRNGRGAYLTNSEDVFNTAKKRDSLTRHLQVQVTADDYDRLIAERVKVKKR
ncbi:YlxR family protein [Shouchella clausii]|uniref:YlxR domain-containing protein n=2 Tax=Shouchella clausii TaxID=79880 RepID=Q5WFU0_SHOC1|nr:MULTISPECIES: YlxR family protein [Shouchella]ALA54875.1 putative nucleic-acid-binding protein [Shouchella clausii]MBU3230857.1 YlxR family protein [Shouchella clausii]MBU3263068.1 YlxR family protein [Shouchella clausii]MBU3505533.1 YlxR family protein [Shouchella clausii]MBU3535990.1 YlxR family protein [Shouchella clausii]